MAQRRKETRPGKGPEPARGPSQRQLRVGELVRHAMSQMLARGEIHDDVLAKHVVTIPEVRMAPDLKLASIYVMPLGGKDIDPVLEALERNKRYIRGEIAHAVNLQIPPTLHAERSDSFRFISTAKPAMRAAMPLSKRCSCWSDPSPPSLALDVAPFSIG